MGLVEIKLTFVYLALIASKYLIESILWLICKDINAILEEHHCQLNYACGTLGHFFFTLLNISVPNMSQMNQFIN